MMTERRHLTTRRAFIAAAGFGGVSLYGLWAVYGASPSPLALFRPSPDEPAMDMSMDMDMGAGAGPTADEFREEVSAFIDRFGLPDGSVYPRAQAADSAQTASGPSENLHEGMAGMDPADTDHMAGMEMADDDGHAAASEPIEVLLLASQFMFEPDHLRLDADQPYRFRMMAAETSHGASIQFGQGARMIRLRPGRVAESELTFDAPGEYLITCTVYCGAGHDIMQARITVDAPQGGEA